MANDFNTPGAIFLFLVLIPFCFFNVLILDFPQRIFSLGVPYVDSLS